MPQRAWLTLAQAYISVSEYRSLETRYGSCSDIVRRSAADLIAAGVSEKKARAVTDPDEAAIERSLEWLNADKHSIITVGDDRYPSLLEEIKGPPLLLYVNGDVDTLHMPCLAIVGSRNPTRGGTLNATQFSRHLAAGGFTVVSGLAEGVDTAAHHGALDGGGKTIAFLGHGIDRVYPASNRDLAHRIAATGALVSEYPLGTAPEKFHFPERNRLISGVSIGTLVVEAARRSGSLITARLAAEQGREVFALPGSIHNPLARGCHTLIRQGAKLVESADDIYAELAPLTERLQQNVMESKPNDSVPVGDDKDYVSLKNALSFDPATIDQLSTESGLTIDQLSSMLLILELRGEVEAHSGGRYTQIA